jgi:hypothetical protein
MQLTEKRSEPTARPRNPAEYARTATEVRLEDQKQTADVRPADRWPTREYDPDVAIA